MPARPMARRRLTEDQDLGVRLLHRAVGGRAGQRRRRSSSRGSTRSGGSTGSGCDGPRATGSRWHCCAESARIRTSLAGRIDAVWYLLTPPLQLIIGRRIRRVHRLQPARPRFLPAALPGHIRLLPRYRLRARGRRTDIRGGRWYSVFTALVLVIPYTIYSWMIFPVLFASLVRQLTGRKLGEDCPRADRRRDDERRGPVRFRPARV